MAEHHNNFRALCCESWEWGPNGRQASDKVCHISIGCNPSNTHVFYKWGPNGRQASDKVCHISIGCNPSNTQVLGEHLHKHSSTEVSHLHCPRSQCRTRPHGVDESYTLSILPSLATLTAKTTWGAMRGLETFSQLAWGNPTWIAVGVQVLDSPLYAHRGIMLDTSRNYFPVKDLLRTVEAMSMNKLNVFHWHVTDSQSFPLVLP
ncbi:hypothetical protein JHK84_043959 [Glycine max]|nr:hypothetical protein JHK84_043959 [Glycine max]